MSKELTQLFDLMAIGAEGTSGLTKNTDDSTDLVRLDSVTLHVASPARDQDTKEGPACHQAIGPSTGLIGPTRALMSTRLHVADREE